MSRRRFNTIEVKWSELEVAWHFRSEDRICYVHLVHNEHEFESHVIRRLEKQLRIVFGGPVDYRINHPFKTMWVHMV